MFSTVSPVSAVSSVLYSYPSSLQFPLYYVVPLVRYSSPFFAVSSVLYSSPRPLQLPLFSNVPPVLNSFPSCFLHYPQFSTVLTGIYSCPVLYRFACSLHFLLFPTFPKFSAVPTILYSSPCFLQFPLFSTVPPVLYNRRKQGKL